MPPPRQMPLIIAHRGVPGERPENTLAGFELALEQGADGLELDVHATRDGTVVVHHDASLPFTEEPSERREIAELTWNELERPTRSAPPIPRLEDVLALVQGRITVFVEVKARGIEALLVSLLRNREGWCAVHSFDHRIPVRIRQLLPGISIGLLSSSYPLDAGEMLRRAGARQLWQSEALIDEALVRQVHAAGVQLVAWTVNSSARALELSAMGVDGLCTDRPGGLRHDLRRAGISA